MTTRHRAVALLVVASVVMLLVVTLPTGTLPAGIVPVTPAAASTTQAKADPKTEILAIVSPVAYPVCAEAGTSTLLVPIVGGLVQNSLHLGKSVDVGDLLLNALGPVFVVCGSLPATPGTQCQLDREIAGIWPAQIGTFASPVPIVGALIDSLTAALKAVGLPNLTVADKALVCSVPTAPPTLAPSGGSLSALPATDGGPTPTGSTPTPGASDQSAGSALAPSAAAPAAPDTGTTPAAAPPRAPTAKPAGLFQAIVDRVPGPIRTLQILLALLVGLFLVGSWMSSSRLVFTSAKRGKKAGSDQQ